MSKERESIPDISHLQFAILNALGTTVKRGKELRADLAKIGVKKSGPAFYQLMARLEEAKFVKGWYEQKIIEGQIIKERHYQILGNGLRALETTEQFYRRRMWQAPLTPAFT